MLDLGSYRMHQPEARNEYVHQGPAIWKLRREPEVTQTESYDIDAECGPGGSGAYDPSIGGAWRVPDGYRYGGERAVVYEIHVVRFTRPHVCLPPV